MKEEDPEVEQWCKLYDWFQRVRPDMPDEEVKELEEFLSNLKDFDDEPEKDSSQKENGSKTRKSRIKDNEK